MPETMPTSQSLKNQFLSLHAAHKEASKIYWAHWLFFFTLGALPMVFYFINSALIPWMASVWFHYIAWLLQLAASFFVTAAVVASVADSSFTGWLPALKAVKKKIMKDVLILVAIGFVLLLGMQASILRPTWLAVYLILANVYIVVKSLWGWKMDQVMKLIQDNFIYLVLAIAVVWGLTAIVYYVFWRLVVLVTGYNLYFYPLLIGIFMAAVWPKMVIYFYVLSKSLKVQAKPTPTV